jgi:hypothetical protein
MTTIKTLGAALLLFWAIEAIAYLIYLAHDGVFGMVDRGRIKSALRAFRRRAMMRSAAQPMRETISSPSSR